MSLGCYLEFINRSFNSITVSAIIRDQGQWEKGSGRPDTSYNNKKISYYESNDMEMNEFLTDCNGEFFFEIQVENENGTTEKQRVTFEPNNIYFNLKQGRKSEVRRNVYYFVEKGFFVRVSRGKELLSIDKSKNKNNKNNDKSKDKNKNYKGMFKVEVFSCSQRRMAVVTDSHLSNDNVVECHSFVDKIAQIKNRPDFIVMCGDLTANNYSDEKKIVEKDLIGELEARNFSVCEGLGNHDVRHFHFDGNMINYVKNRKRDSEGKLEGYFKDTYEKLHYHWEYKLYKDDHCIVVNCFMLNLVPGLGILGQVEEYEDKDNNKKEKSKEIKKVEKDERNPFHSLDFLNAYLSKYNASNISYKDKNDKARHVVLLFFHINYESENAGTAGYGPERWWPYYERRDFDKVVKNYKDCRIIGTFFGHQHSEDTRIETLKSPDKDFGLTGFKVGAFLKNTTFLDLELEKENGEYMLKGAIKYMKTDDISQEINRYRTINNFSINFNDL